MKATSPWHSTHVGLLVRWLGSIQLAVPVLSLVTIAMVWGTYIESTQDAKIAKATVYLSWWFIALMGLVCVSLIFAAISRYPWKRKHVGFLVVHASLVALIAGGFWSLFGRIEGHLMLEQGTSSAIIETSEDQLEIVEHNMGEFKVIDAVPAPARPGRVSIAGLDLEIVECWSNVQESFEIVDDNPEPYRAVQIQFGPVAESAMWIGDEAHGTSEVIAGIRVRVLPADAKWTPPAETPAADSSPRYQFVIGDKQFPLPAEGQEAFPGWKVTAVRSFSHASVSAGSITNETAKQENPAIDVTITDGQGTTERHTAFDLFPDMVLSKTLEGSARSGARLVCTRRPPSTPGEETLVIYGEPPAMKLAHISAAGKVTLREHAGEFPYTAEFGDRRLVILNQFAHARDRSKFTQGPPTKDRRPALVVQIGESQSPIAWKSMLPVDLKGRAGMLRYGPKSVPLPFSVRLDQFRKMDYPGTDMAMAYESSVTVSSGSQPDQATVISMNNPLKHSGWKVYQSGFQGDMISIFSVMRDPGLPLTYLACTTLCIGIMITFYGRGLSRGHPGIPLPFTGKEQSNAPIPELPGSVVPSPVSDTGFAEPRLGPADVGAPDPGRRTRDAAGHVRA